MITTTDSLGNSYALASLPPAWNWTDLLSAEPELCAVADAISSAPLTGGTYGRGLLAIEQHIDWLADHRGRLSPRQADEAYRILRRRVEVAL